MNNLTFEWDEAKRRSNRKKHGLDFVDAAELFKDASFQVFADIRHGYGEVRWVGLGMLGGLVAVGGLSESIAAGHQDRFSAKGG
jgi:uncharacterized DUF497 family protein